MCDELRCGDFPSIRFSTGLTPERYSSSAWYTARETWNVCYRFVRARGAPSAWGTLFWGLALLIISIPEVPRRSSNGGKGPVPELYMSMASALPNLPYPFPISPVILNDGVLRGELVEGPQA